MSKTSNIIIRVSEEEKERAVEVSEFLGYKNLSQFFRNYVNEIYELINPVEKGFNFDTIIKDLQEQYEKEKGYNRFSLQTKINTLKQIKELYNK